LPGRLTAPGRRQARQQAAGDDADPGDGDWSAGEVTAVVEDYLEMLQAEITGQRYVKTHHRRALLPRLNPVRTGGAVEYKHQNISAAMLDLGLPWIRSYKPMSNDQDAFADDIQRQLEADSKLLLVLRDGIEKDRPHDQEDDAAPGTVRLRRTPAPAPPAPAAVKEPPGPPAQLSAQSSQGLPSITERIYPRRDPATCRIFATVEAAGNALGCRAMPPDLCSHEGPGRPGRTGDGVPGWSRRVSHGVLRASEEDRDAVVGWRSATAG
jgi:hypothetical protein